MADAISLQIEVPVCAFRPYASREYQDTYPIPTPASVYGMLLSLLGVPRAEKSIHRGTGMALAVEGVPEQSKVFRKLRRGSDLEDSRPDYQDLLTDLRLWVWIRRGMDEANTCLADRLQSALADRFATVSRAGGVSLGESSYLINSISAREPPDKLIFVVPDKSGFYSLPVWVDHAAADNTKIERFRVDDEATEVRDSLPNAWFQIPIAPEAPPGSAESAPPGRRRSRRT